MKIVISANELYVKNLTAAVRSCQLNYPTGDIVARLINFSSELRSSFAETFPGVEIYDITYNESETREHLCNNGALLQDGMFGIYDKKRSDFKGARWLYSDMMARIINDRYQILLDLLNDGAECVLSIDADTIIRGDLIGLKKQIMDHDVALHGEIVTDGNAVDFGETIQYNEIPKLSREQYKSKEFISNNPNYIEWHTGVIGFNNTPTSLKILTEYTETLLKPENIHIWGAEEEEIYFLYLKYHEMASFYNIPILYKDEGYGTDRRVGSNQYDENSRIWVGAGQNKYNCTLFTEEVNKYA